MSRRRMFAISLVSFFLLWRMFTFAAAIRSGTTSQAAPPAAQATLTAPRATHLAGIPVTGQPERLWTEILLFYGSIGLTALVLIAALLNLAHKSSVTYQKGSFPDGSRKNESDR